MATPGTVIHLRVNPKDSMSVIDTLNYLGIPAINMSFAQATKLVLSAALESFRQQGFIPVRSGFEYSKMMEPFGGISPADRANKLIVADIIKGEGFQVKPVVPEDYDKMRRRLRYEEMMIKKNSDEINWTEEDQAEFTPLVDEFFV